MHLCGASSCRSGVQWEGGRFPPSATCRLDGPQQRRVEGGLGSASLAGQRMPTYTPHLDCSLSHRALTYMRTPAFSILRLSRHLTELHHAHCAMPSATLGRARDGTRTRHRCHSATILTISNVVEIRFSAASRSSLHHVVRYGTATKTPSQCGLEKHDAAEAFTCRCDHPPPASNLTAPHLHLH